MGYLGISLLRNLELCLNFNFVHDRNTSFHKFGKKDIWHLKKEQRCSNSNNISLLPEFYEYKLPPKYSLQSLYNKNGIWWKNFTRTLQDVQFVKLSLGDAKEARKERCPKRYLLHLLVYNGQYAAPMTQATTHLSLLTDQLTCLFHRCLFLVLRNYTPARSFHFQN